LEILEKNTTMKNYTSNSLYLQTAGLPPDVQKDVAAYYNDKLDNPNDNIHQDDFAKIAFYKTIEFGFLSLFLYDMESDEYLFNEGYFQKQISSIIQNYLHRLTEKNKRETYPVYIQERLYELELRLCIHDSRKFVLGVIVQEKNIQTETVNQIEKFFNRYFFPDFDFADVYEFNCLPALNQMLCQIAMEAEKSQQRLHYILIEIEPLKKYIKVAGDYLVNEIIQNVKNEITSIIENHDRCYILNSRQYLIAALNMDENIIKNKLGHAHFRIKNLLLMYQMNCYEVMDFKNGYAIESAWPKLMKNNPTL